MKKRILHIFLWLLCVTCALRTIANDTTKPYLQWAQLPAIPDPVGLAGSFAGVSNGALLVAGGSNFGNGTPWNGGVKTWYDKIFVLEQANGSWKEAGQLPHPLAYGVSCTWQDGVIIAGGNDQDFLTGGAGADRFEFGAISHSSVGEFNRDIITDFVRGTDEIDLSRIRDFDFIGKKAFTAAGQVRFDKVGTDTVTTDDDRTIISVNVQGSSGAEMEIELVGLYNLKAGDFIL